MGEQLDRAQAWALLTEFNQDPFHLHHARTVEGVMRYFAQELGYGDEVDFWGIVGLLHDLDFERYPDQHCIRSQEIMRERGLDERLIHATASHGYGITVDIVPEHEMEKVLYATDELTGLIGAAALMRPSKSVQDMELKSLKKKYKSSGLLARGHPARRRYARLESGRAADAHAGRHARGRAARGRTGSQRSQIRKGWGCAPAFLHLQHST